jgi:outer membrane protein
MIRRLAVFVFTAAIGLAAPVAAQPSLSLAQAIARARAQNPDVGSAAAAEREAAQRSTQARAGYWPRVDVAEAWQHGDQPVFVFGALLAQRRFTAADFSLESLNHPDPLDNFRLGVTIEQTLFGGATGPSVAAAGIDRDMATARRVAVDQDLAASVTTAYGQALVAAAAQRSAAAAVEAASADRELAANRRDAGLVTDADVLQLDVYVSRAREQQIRAASDERIARAQLNQLMGEPLERVFVLDDFTPAAAQETSDLERLEAEALNSRPDVKLAALYVQLAEATLRAARAAFLPQVAAQAGWELNGGAWNTGVPSWAIGVVARVNLFNGFADKARLAEARERATRLALERDKANTSARLDVYAALARVDAARASDAVGRAAAEQARESRRIIRDRYAAGLTDVASLLRATEALVQAETQQTVARAAVLTADAALERSLGRR